MKLWTHHVSSFQIDGPEIRIQPELGWYWNHREANFRYRQIAPVLWDIVGTNQFLWCCLSRGSFIRPTDSIDLTEWEIDAPPAEIIAVINAQVWESLVWNKTDNWKQVFSDDIPPKGNNHYQALVRVPLPTSSARCNGQLQPQHNRRHLERAELLRRETSLVDLALRDEYDFDAK